MKVPIGNAIKLNLHRGFLSLFLHILYERKSLPLFLTRPGFNLLLLLPLLRQVSQITRSGRFKFRSFPRVRFRTSSLDFSINLILPAALWSWSLLSL
jgi:hypothetical protein